MKTLKFKTNINCGGCIARVTPKLNETKGIISWKVDTDNPDKILTVETETLSDESVMEPVKKAGFQISRILMIVALVMTVFTQGLIAQGTQMSDILSSYYTVKDALVTGDANAAAARAGELLKAVNGVDMSKLPEKEHKAFMALQDKLAFDARHISEKKEIGHQREHFASLSANMIALAQAVKLSAQPVYEDYCPMKKASWLSGEPAIKNPYYGNAMLTCGKITATLKP